jgi:hypothetical protein
MDPTWATKHEEARNFAIAHYWNIVNDIHVVLTKRPEELSPILMEEIQQASN